MDCHVARVMIVSLWVSKRTRSLWLPPYLHDRPGKGSVLDLLELPRAAIVASQGFMFSEFGIAMRGEHLAVRVHLRQGNVAGTSSASNARNSNVVFAP